MRILTFLLVLRFATPVFADEPLADKLKDAGILAKVVAAEGTNHGAITSNMGKAGDRPTEEMWASLAGAVKKEAPAGPAVNGLQLSLIANTTEIAVNDGKVKKPVALKLTFTNVSDKPIKFNAYDFSWSRIKGNVKAQPADSVTIQRLAADRKIRPPVAGDFIEIKPGQTWSPGSMLAFPGSLPESVGSKSVYEVLKPGEFRLRFRYSSAKIDNPLANDIWVGELVSNEVAVTAKK